MPTLVLLVSIAAGPIVDNVAALRQLPVADGAVVTVRGYRRPADDGGGTFRFDAGSAAEDDAGSILAPAGGRGRFVRIVAPGADRFAEWFGAYGDATHDDQVSINACLGAYGRVKLRAKVYGVRGKPTHYNPQATYHAVDLAKGYRIEGSGRELTTIRLLAGSNPHGSAPTDNYFNLLGNRGFHESADFVEIRDLTLDGNFDEQNKHTTINLIGIRGGGALVERVNFRRFGTGRNPESGSSREAFVIHQGLVYRAPGSSRRAAVLRDLDFTDPGHNGDVGGKVGEITLVAVGGAHNFGNYSWILPGGKDPDWDPTDDGENQQNWWPSYGGLIEDCVFHDMVYNPAAQQSPLHAITYGDCIGLVVRHNRVENMEGSAHFVMSWWNKGVSVYDNQFLNVTCGFSIHIKGTDGKPLQAPWHEDLLVENNTITLGAPVHDPYGARGVHLYGQDLGEGVRLRNITIRNNRISGRSYLNDKGQKICPVGIGFQVLHANYDGIRILDNEIDTPDYAAAGWVPQQPNSLALTFFPLARWADEVKTGKVLYRGNHTPDGTPLRPALCDWYYQNEPTWGTPEGPVKAE